MYNNIKNKMADPISSGEGRPGRQILLAVTASLTMFFCGTAAYWRMMRLEHGFYTLYVMLFTPILSTPILAVAVDTLGRKVTIMLISVLLVLSQMLSLFPTLYTEIAANVLTGAAMGGTLLVVPIYIREVSPDSMRRALGTIFIPASIFGYTFSSLLPRYVFNSYLSILVTCLAIAISLYIVAFAFLPETPAFCVKKQRYEQAARSVAWLRGLDPSDSRVLQRVEQLKSEDAEQTSPLTAIFKLSTLKLLGSTLVMMIAGALCGFNDALTHSLGSLGILLHYSVQLVGCFALLFTVEKIGFKRIIAGAAVAVAACLCAEYALHYTDSYDEGWLIITVRVLHMFSHQVGLSALPYVFITETFGVRLRAPVLGLAVTVNMALQSIVNPWLLMGKMVELALALLAVCAAVLAVWGPGTGGGDKSTRRDLGGHQAENTTICANGEKELCSNV